MDVWIDFTNAPHVHYFSQLINKFEKEGIEYIITLRDFKNLENIVKLYDYTSKPISIGKHGGTSEEKLINSAKRIIDLTKLIKDNKPKVAIAKHSVELPRVAYGLGIPSIFTVDNEYAEAQNRLTMPLVNNLIVPEGINKTMLRKQGGRDFISFKGTCEVANINSRLNEIIPINKNIVNELNLNPDIPIIIMRSCPNSSYCNGNGDIIPKIIEKLNKKIDCNIVAFSRTDAQKETYKLLNAVVPHSIDAISLIYHANAMIGAGGTMNRESAVMGIPTVSCYPQHILGVDKYLMEKNLMVHTKSVNNIVKYVIDNINNKNDNKNKNNKLKLEDPTNLMFEKVCEYLY